MPPDLSSASALALSFSHLESSSPELGSWSLWTATPAGWLADYVKVFWTLESAEAESRELMLPRSSTEVMFNLGGPAFLYSADGSPQVFAEAWISGLQQRALDIESDPNARFAGIRFHPLGVLPFLGTPPAETAGDVLTLELFFGRRNVEELRQRLAEETHPGRRLTLLALDVARRITAGRSHRAEVRGALAEIHQAGGQVAVRQLVESSRLSHRYFSARFREEIGLRPKSFLRVVRFERLIRHLATRPAVLNWAELALDCGYFDQAHMAREVREMSSATPTQVARRLSPDGLSLPAKGED